MKEFGKIGRILLAAVLGVCVVALLVFSHYSSQGRVRNGENIERIRRKVEDFRTARENAKHEAEERNWRTVKVWKMVPLVAAGMTKKIEEAAHEKRINFEELKKMRFPKGMFLAPMHLPYNNTKTEERGDMFFVSAPKEFLLHVNAFDPRGKKHRFRAEFEGHGSVSFGYIFKRSGIEKGLYKRSDFPVLGMKTQAELVIPDQDFYNYCLFEMRLAGDLTCRELILQEESMETEETPGASQKQ